MLPRVLVIAGSDSSGGAGLEADQRVLTAHGVYSLTATTGLTAQNTLGVQDIHVVPPAFVRKQINAALEDVGADVVKLGMLSSAETVDVIAEQLKKHAVKTIVLDPVMISTSGSQLLPPDAIQHVRTNLLPLTTVLTPNIPEAKLLLENAGESMVEEPQNVNEMIELAKKVQRLGSKAVLLKGGHLPFTYERIRAKSIEEASIVVDVLYSAGDRKNSEEEEVVMLTETEYLRSKNTHGTGCSLASAIAANLAKGNDLKTSVHSAIKYVEAGIKLSVDMGQGSGPINHFHSLYSMPFAPGQFVDYVLNRPDMIPVWHKFTHHEFVQKLGDGNLPLANFKDYLVQDYLYLVQFARSNALASYKARTMKSIAASARIVLHINTETALHVDYCASFGLTREEMEATPEKQACVAYSRYILDIGQSEDWLALQIALAPCLIGYGAIARRLYDDADHTVQGEENNRYWKWIQNYVAEDYVTAVKTGSALLEEHMHQVSPSRLEELVAIFKRATELEIGFWDMGMGI